MAAFSSRRRIEDTRDAVDGRPRPMALNRAIEDALLAVREAGQPLAVTTHDVRGPAAQDGERFRARPLELRDQEPVEDGAGRAVERSGAGDGDLWRNRRLVTEQLHHRFDFEILVERFEVVFVAGKGSLRLDDPGGGGFVYIPDRARSAGPVGSLGRRGAGGRPARHRRNRRSTRRPRPTRVHRCRSSRTVSRAPRPRGRSRPPTMTMSNSSEPFSPRPRSTGVHPARARRR